jgi:hypothetical protein
LDYFLLDWDCAVVVAFSLLGVALADGGLDAVERGVVDVD